MKQLPSLPSLTPPPLLLPTMVPTWKCTLDTRLRSVPSFSRPN